MTTITEASWDAALDVLRDATEPVLACHIGPDGDALGSMLALAIGLRSRGASPIASFSEPFVVPDQYGLLPAQHLTRPQDVPAEPEVMVTFDCGSFDRLGTLEPNARAADTLIVVDHHVSNADFGEINLIDATSAASAVIARELLRRLGVELTRDIATCLYTGLVTDTGRFQYKNTTPEVHHLAAELLAAGAPHDQITTAIYATHPVGFLKIAARALDRLLVTQHMVWTWITLEDLSATNTGIEQTDALIDLVRTAETSDVALVLKQQPDGSYKASMRSKGATNVGALCEGFGGGGHALAAGFKADDQQPGPIAERVAKVLASGSLPPVP